MSLRHACKVLSLWIPPMELTNREIAGEDREHEL
jgi:hypothetical protein